MKIAPLEWRADRLFGGESGFVGTIQYRHVGYDYGGAVYGHKNYPTLDDAKAQAQKEHEEYIRNALLPD